MRTISGWIFSASTSDARSARLKSRSRCVLYCIGLRRHIHLHTNTQTDPKNADYIAEHGITRNFEVWRMADKEDGPVEEEEENPMKVSHARGIVRRHGLK